MQMQEDNQAPATQPAGNRRWYVVHAYSGFEKSVAQALRDRIVRMGMEDRFGFVTAYVRNQQARAELGGDCRGCFAPGGVPQPRSAGVSAAVPTAPRAVWRSFVRGRGAAAGHDVLGPSSGIAARSEASWCAEQRGQATVLGCLTLTANKPLAALQFGNAA